MATDTLTVDSQTADAAPETTPSAPITDEVGRQEASPLSYEERRDNAVRKAAQLRGDVDAEPTTDGPTEGTGDGTDESLADSPATRARDEKGRFASQRADGSDAPTADLDKAKHVLRLNAVSDDVIDAMDEQRIREAADKLTKRESDRRREREELLEFKRKFEQAQAAEDHPASDDATSDPQPSDPQPSEPVPIGEAVKAVIGEALESVAGLDPMDEDYATNLRDTMGVGFTAVAEKVSETLSQQFDAKFAAQEQVNAELQKANQAEALRREDMQIRLAAGEIADQYPQIRDKHEQLCEKVYALAHGDSERLVYYDDQGNPDWAQLVEDAARKEFGPANTKKQIQADMATQARKVADGQMTVGDSRDGNPANLSPLDRVKLKAKALREGKSVADAKRTVPR